MEASEQRFGAQSMTAPLRRVFVRRPGARSAARWREYGWRDAPDPLRLVAEHEAFVGILEGAGAEVIVGAPDEGDPDAIYTFDPALVTPAGTIALRPGKVGRRDEPEAISSALELAGVPRAGAIDGPATVEGGDTLWLDEQTLLVGHGYRTNSAGIEALRSVLPQVEVIPFDLPHHRGRGEVLHLMSLISPVDADLAVVYLPLLPVRLVELLLERDIALVEVPDAEFETLAANVLALGPRQALVLEGNPITRARLERAGVDVTIYEGDEISRKGDGGPTCLTRPVWRA